MTEQSNSLDEAIRRSKLSSSNQMEMLTFRLTDGQLYGINVFKIIEILECPERIDKLPQSHPAVKGVISFRGQGITVIDVSESIGMEKVDFQNELAYLVVCEYNNQLNAFLVKQPETLLTRGWDEIKKPEGFHAPSVVAIGYADNEEMILILDIETVLVDVIGMDANLDQQFITQAAAKCAGKKVLLVDDSNSAMSLMQNTMEKLGIEHNSFNSAVKALEYLHTQIDQNQPPRYDLIISDIEMPGMDGFTFTRNVRSLDDMTGTPIALHSSMSNPTNQQKAVEAGADEFIPKFNPEALSELVLRLTA
ncbi:two-component system, chemotaxis family, response regulator CheV [Malonomonas rubra DSM 5091]|uniref:Two-component system, chemotaxis family, response regulator CheV n=1 Tax=Malonomonas rubra DSM 5091 TaxID=1122189 RepID=A0A1M6F3H9_MALRU|nr:chemotaxis protein [Malonomonas rubra]SHI92206.1 two-component system, chemotaxis family, response regulator CheV [Malonomonas rubra DSM 5091]